MLIATAVGHKCSSWLAQRLLCHHLPPGVVVCTSTNLSDTCRAYIMPNCYARWQFMHAHRCYFGAGCVQGCPVGGIGLPGTAGAMPPGPTSLFLSAHTPVLCRCRFRWILASQEKQTAPRRSPLAALMGRKKWKTEEILTCSSWQTCLACAPCTPESTARQWCRQSYFSGEVKCMAVT